MITSWIRSYDDKKLQLKKYVIVEADIKVLELVGWLANAKYLKIFWICPGFYAIPNIVFMPLL